MKAIDKFDITSPDKFPAYFSLWVMQSMQRYGMIKGTIMRYPTHYQERLLVIVTKACEIMEDDNFEEAVEWVYNEEFKDEGITKEHLLPYVQFSEELEDEDVSRILIQKSLKEMLDAELLRLKDKERGVIELRYGLRDGRERTLEEVGRIYNVTRERIRQIESKALRKLRQSKKLGKFEDYM